MAAITFASLGDCCVDIYPQEHKAYLGGTAFNVAYAAREAGATTSLLSAVGNDRFAKYYKSACKEIGIASRFLSVLPGKTSTVDIVLDSANSPTFSNWELGVLQERTLSGDEKAFLKTQDIVRGVLFKPVSIMFEEFAKLSLPNTLKVGDFLGSSEYSYRTSPITAYANSLDIIIKSVEENESEDLAFLHSVAKKYDRVVVALLGERGSVAFTRLEAFTVPAIKTNVVNTTGAGDAYQAYFAYWYKKTRTIPKAMREATRAASRTIAHLACSYEKPITM